MPTFIYRPTLSVTPQNQQAMSIGASVALSTKDVVSISSDSIQKKTKQQDRLNGVPKTLVYFERCEPELSIGPISVLEKPLWNEFLRSVQGLQTFYADLSDIPGFCVPVDPESARINKDPSWNSLNSHYWQVQFDIHFTRILKL